MKLTYQLPVCYLAGTGLPEISTTILPAAEIPTSCQEIQFLVAELPYHLHEYAPENVSDFLALHLD